MSRHHYLLNYIGALTAFLAFLSHDVASLVTLALQSPSPALVPLFSSFLLCKSSRKHLLARRLQAASKLTAHKPRWRPLLLLALLSSWEYDSTLLYRYSLLRLY